MFNLPLPEMLIFFFVAVIYISVATVGVFQLLSGGQQYNRLLLPLISLAIILEAVILTLRALVIKALPLTGLFDSLIFLTILFGIVYLILNIFIRQVWFSSVMVWIILVLFLITAIFAKPVAEPLDIAATPWALVHGLMMVLGGVSIIFATANSILYLLGHNRLKSKKIMTVIGRLPSIEKLEHMAVYGIEAGFIFISIGIIGGLGLVVISGSGIVTWLLDLKVICILAAWLLLGIVLILNRLFTLKGKTIAFLTLATFMFVILAIVGVTILGKTQHDFTVY